MKTVSLVALLVVTCCIGGCASEEPAAHRIVRDPLASRYKDILAKKRPDANTVSVAEADFNCDGRKDMAITDSNMGGSGGSIWELYIRRPGGWYMEIGEVATKDDRFRISRRKNGVGQLAVMLRGGSGDISIIFYEVSQAALREIRTERVHLTGMQSGRTRIEEVFGDDYSELPAKEFTIAQLKAKFQK